MIVRFITELGPWVWMLLGFVLLTLEIFAPGVFLLWIGIAALLVGALSLQLWDWASWTWHAQVLTFVVLSLASAYLGKRITNNSSERSDQPLLNQRGAQMVGRTATLTEAIREGRGRIKLGDTTWRVSGPDLPVGTQVRVVAAGDTDLELVVEPV
ncbi:MAG: NfeD family protein [Proteobacteria bacterium]|uniref:NfeD family protein n=1 Tax=Hyphomicrobiales TaxID=356 RepID=UPI000365D0A3|nr:MULTISPECIES: NfeD family protein [Phyllobacteriaceae]MCA0278318.1 NfeD family protein [Pseudomonadota bacterium]MCX8569773.1 NfeD family protein [Aminobacter sp. MET-1]